MNVGDGDVLIPLALIFAGRETEGSQDHLVGVEEALGQIPEKGTHNAVRDSDGLIIIAVPPAKLLQPELAFLGLIPTTGCVGLLLTARHYTKDLCDHNFKSSRRDSLSPEIGGKGTGTVPPYKD